MQSMTGFGSIGVRSAPWVFYIQVKSVNGRFFDLKLNIPPFLSPIELDLRSVLQNTFHRGSIELYMRSEIQDLGVSKVPGINVALLKHYLKSIKLAHKELGYTKSEVQLNWSDLLKLPDVIKFESIQEISKAQKKAILRGVKEASLICKKEREREGADLKGHLSSVLTQLEYYLKRIETISLQDPKDTPTETYRERVKSFLEKKGIEFSEARLLEEWAYYRERAAIYEEIERLKTHLENFRKLFNTSEPVGKRLDFYTQELLREFNTIGSKTNHSQVTELVVESKSLIERLREQVQNIE
jgi:uncharacterized protein (TIGR00255 family)